MQSAEDLHSHMRKISRYSIREGEGERKMVYIFDLLNIYLIYWIYIWIYWIYIWFIEYIFDSLNINKVLLNIATIRQPGARLARDLNWELGRTYKHTYVWRETFGGY